MNEKLTTYKFNNREREAKPEAYMFTREIMNEKFNNLQVQQQRT
jgi:hypothetical protein